MSKVLTPEVVEDIINTYKQTRNSPFKTSRMCGVDVEVVFAVIDDNQDRLSAVPERNGGQGRAELVPFIVARRKAAAREWNNKEPAILQARERYEAGTHIMTTGRDGQWLLLYSIPRQNADPKPKYFTPECS